MKYSAVLFDLDGTLTDPVQGICGSVRYALEKAGRPVGPIESYHKYIGPPLLRSFEVYANATPEEAQELLGLLIIELVDQVGCIVRVHHGQHRRCVRVGQALEHLGHKLVIIELRDGLGGLGGVELCKYLRTQARVELLDNVSNIGRVQLTERLVRHRKLNVLS